MNAPSNYDTIFDLASIDAFSSSQYLFHENDQTTAYQVALYQQMACALASFFSFFEREREIRSFCCGLHMHLFLFFFTYDLVYENLEETSVLLTISRSHQIPTPGRSLCTVYLLSQCYLLGVCVHNVHATSAQTVESVSFPEQWRSSKTSNEFSGLGTLLVFVFVPCIGAGRWRGVHSFQEPIMVPSISKAQKSTHAFAHSNSNSNLVILYHI